MPFPDPNVLTRGTTGVTITAPGERSPSTAHDRAVRYWEQTLAAAGAERYPLLIELGRARRRAGDLGRARADLREAIAAATRAGDTAAVVDAAAVFGG
jgi:hypothetical protein